MTIEIHDELKPPPAAPARGLSWREKRWERRRKRLLFEELLGWILVPVILFAGYWFLTWVLESLGTSPGAIVTAIQTLLGNH